MPNILLVEDEDILRETFVLIMSRQSYNIDTAQNGQVALELCKNTDYDLILLDLMMPVLDGIGFLKQFGLKKTASQLVRPVKTKIIILSNLSSGTELETAMSLGASRSLLKASMSPRELLAMVSSELEAYDGT